MTAVPASVRLHPPRLRSRAGRRDADFAAVYERHHQALYRYCRSILHDDHDAQDALQNAMTKAFAALQDERREIELRPWLFRIAHNEAITLLRKRRGTSTLDDATPASGELEDRVAEREELRLLRMDLETLPERQRAALVLRELNGLSHAEIGAVLDLSIAGVKQALFDARTALSDSRDGRALACAVVRRTLSDGDGRVLRRRTVRAHLRTCAPCRGFRAELSLRPQALRLLAPPLPVAGAAGLASSLLGGPAVKLLACVALAGGGSTVAAVEFQHARDARDRTPQSTPARASAVVTATPAAAKVTLPALAHATPVATAEADATSPSTRRTRPPRAVGSPAPRGATHRKTAPATSAPHAAGGSTPQAPSPAESQDRSVSIGAGTAEERSASADKPLQGRGRSESAPGHADAKPGNSGTARGHSDTAPGNSSNAPGHAGGMPGNSENAPGRSGATPGNSENAPGHSGATPGNSQTAPGQTADAPGKSENAPGQTADAPGQSAESLGQSADAPGLSKKSDTPS